MTGVAARDPRGRKPRHLPDDGKEVEDETEDAGPAVVHAELAAGVEAGTVAHADVTELGAVLAGDADGRRSDDDITLFDSTGLAIQDLAIARAALLKSVEMDLPRLDL